MQVAESTTPAIAPEPPVLVARDGSDTLRFVEAVWLDETLPAALGFAFGSTEPDTLLARGPQATVGPWQDGSSNGRSVATRVQGNEVFLDASNLDRAAVQVDLAVVRVREWKQHERAGLMDASLDEVEWPPYLLRFAGEGESFWLSASLMDPEKPMPEGTDPSAVLSHAFAAETAIITDAKGRVLVRHSGSIEGESALASFSTHAPGTPPPEGEPTIQYPVTVRLRVPAEWTSEVRKFRFRGLPAETAPTGR